VTGGGDGAVVSTAQRALWTFLGYTLLGPFLAALAVAAAMILAPVLRLAPLLPEGLPPVGAAALATFVWSAIPAALTALALLPTVIRRGSASALMSAAAGIVAFAAANALFPIAQPTILTGLALLAGLVALAVRSVLSGTGILAR
jgi:hypothetical protein